MNLNAAAIVLRPRSTSEIADLAFRFCVGPGFRAYARLSAWVLLPGYAGCLALRYGAGVAWGWVWFIAVFFALAAQAPFTVAVGRMMFSENVTASQALRTFFGRLGPYLRSVALFFLMFVLLGWTIAYIPILYVRMLFFHEACLLEGLSRGVYDRCRKLVDGRISAALGILMLVLFARVGGMLVAELLGMAVLDEVLQLGRPFGALFGDGGSPFALLGFFLSVPYTVTARFLQYVDVRTRSDGWDVQLRFMAIASRDEQGRKAA